jgi:hypothetical protein
MDEFDAIKTPATDAFLAEVRASAVDEVCLKISNAIINCYQDEQVGLMKRQLSAVTLHQRFAKCSHEQNNRQRASHHDA